MAGLNGYECCEPHTQKVEILKRRLPQLRRVSMSPWCDVERAAKPLEDHYVFSWKPNPALRVGNFDEGRIRNTIRHTLDVAAGCCPEIIPKDTISLDNDPRRVIEWLCIVREISDHGFGIALLAG